MRENINKVTERGERLDSLQDKTGKQRCLFGGEQGRGSAATSMLTVSDDGTAETPSS